MTLRALSAETGADTSTLRDWEKDRHQAPHRMLSAIARATGASGDFLLGLTDEPGIAALSPEAPHSEPPGDGSLSDLGQPLPGEPPESLPETAVPPKDAPARTRRPRREAKR